LQLPLFFQSVHIFLTMGNTGFEKAVEEMERYSCKTEIIAGPGSVSRLAELGSKRLLLVTDPYFQKDGTAHRVAQAAQSPAVEIFDRVIPDPTVELAAAGAARVKEFRPDLIVALGGGSAMDCAKAMAYFGGGNYRLAAIPTTSGSGSEVTDFAILTHNGVKHPLVDEKLRPDLAILDSDLLQKLPRSLIADSGFDVLAHALEACAAANRGSITDCLARESFRMAMSALPRSFAGDTSVRLEMHKAASMAGLAFTQAGLGLCHAMAHALGGAFHVPHGRLNAILLPAVLDCNAPSAMGAYAAMARAAGFSASSDVMAVRAMKNGLVRLRRELNLPETLVQAGADIQKLRVQEQKIVEAALADPCCQTNPVKPEAHMIRGILSTVLGRG
jgi:alcohol dehydrogenase class IV